MKKNIVIIMMLLLATPAAFAQNRALRVDSLEINDKNVTGFFNDQLSTDLMEVSVDTLLIFTVSDSSDTTYITDNGTNLLIDSENPILLDSKFLSWASKVYIDSVGIYGMDATDADTFKIYDSGDTTFVNSDNPFSFDKDVLFVEDISAKSVTDRTDYVGKKNAIKLLKKVNLKGLKKFKNCDDVLILPYELRNKQHRSLSRCVSLLLAVAQAQQEEIEKLKKREWKK